jgi:hypothetical protein
MTGEYDAALERLATAADRIATALEKLAERRDTDTPPAYTPELCKICGLADCDDFDSNPIEIGTPWWKGMMPGEEIIKTPGAPPPERPDGIQFDVIREPEFKEGDTIRVVTPEGERTFIVGEIEPEPEPEPLSPHWAWVASFDAGKPHPYLIGTGDEGFCNVCGLRTSMLHTVYNAMESLKKISPQRLTRRTE